MTNVRFASYNVENPSLAHGHSTQRQAQQGRGCRGGGVRRQQSRGQSMARARTCVAIMPAFRPIHALWERRR